MITAPIFDVAWPRPHLPVMEPHNGPYSLALQMSSPGISWWSIYNKYMYSYLHENPIHLVLLVRH